MKTLTNLFFLFSLVACGTGSQSPQDAPGSAQNYPATADATVTPITHPAPFAGPTEATPTVTDNPNGPGQTQEPNSANPNVVDTSNPNHTSHDPNGNLDFRYGEFLVGPSASPNAIRQDGCNVTSLPAAYPFKAHVIAGNALTNGSLDHGVWTIVTVYGDDGSEYANTTLVQTYTPSGVGGWEWYGNAGSPKDGCSSVVSPVDVSAGTP